MKALGPDGFSEHFFEKHWDICGQEVTRVVLCIVEGEDSDEVQNGTFLSQFCRISLCNLLYK